MSETIGFGGRVVLTGASWGAAAVAWFAFWTDEWTHVGVWAFVSLALYGTRRYLDTGSE